ncbi:MAG: phosphate starvation-inducible protein PhoH [Bordetella sp. SCN 67-23]|nr:PhoH family protein [Burkholderiales bacterium]ODS69813.1 MAG: phosphate starvation-inducible protein PhoH [Bordetella sp. SCN 67-23]OJW91689.1 MAG: phosphate starvation-inducible protein PhoH [Burkholderiales bacterium 67-32]
MPLPKMPTRPAAILSFPSGEPARPAARGKRTEAEPRPPSSTDIPAVQPQLEGIQAAPAKTARKTSAKPKAGTLLTPAPQPAAPIVARAPQPAPVPAPAATGKAVAKPAPKRKAKSAGPEVAKLFVLDTNVLMHDPSSLFRFEEHDIFLPMITLEELDNHKKGMSEVARNARQVSRSLDELVSDIGDMEAGIPLDKLGNRDAMGRLYLQTTLLSASLPSGLPAGKADNQILGVVRALQERYPDREVVLVSKDINMRVKARALGLPAEDYFNDQVLEDSDLLYTGVLQLPDDFWDKHSKGMESWQQGGSTFYRITGPLCAQFAVNQFVYFEGSMPLYAQVKEVNGKTAVLQTLREYTHSKNSVWGITARNREQNFALNLLMNPDCDFISLLGQAGTGKTLLALAAGLTQVLETKRYTEIIMTRVTVPVGEDIGFLPGTEEEKMLPWMGALEDNLDVLNMGDGESGHGGDWGRAATMDLIRSRVKVKSLNFMRGRTFLNKFLIIDEAQNLTPKQMKTLITRAGPGTKVVCLGNIAQIDTPYLTEGSSGLTYVVDRFKGWPHSGHVTLQRGERSRLADYAAEVL